MRFALSLAQHAESLGEVPVGALIVQDNRIISTGFNLRERQNLASAHAEVRAIDAASQVLQRWRLTDCELYVTLEPCLMCAGLIMQSRLQRVVFGAFDPKGGALGSLYAIHSDQRLNHRYPVSGGVLEASCRQQLSQFFAARRSLKAKAKEEA